jgi:integrase
MHQDNPFSDPSIPSFEQIRDRIASDYSILRQRRMDMVSAINRLPDWLGLPLSMIPANTEFLRQKFKNFHHDQAGVTKRRVQNVRSLLMRAMRCLGLPTTLASYQSHMSDEWQLLYDALPGRYAKTALSRFMRYCSKQKILPGDVNDAIAARFLDALVRESLIKNPKVTHQTVCRVWNQMADAVDRWPTIKLTVPCYDDGRIYAISDDLLPPHLIKETDAYLEFLKGDDLFSGLAKPFRPASVTAVRGNIHRYLSALHHDGFDIASLRSLADMVEFDVFKRAMKWFWKRNEEKTSKHIGEIAWTLRCIAVKHLKCDEETAKLYRDAIEKLRVPQNGLSEKNTAVLRQFDDPRLVVRFLNYPDNLFDAAKKLNGQKAHLLAQAATATLILTFAPMRIKNLAELRIDQNLNWVSDRLHIHVPAGQVKNNETLHFIFPAGASERVRNYIDRDRSLFLPNANPFLFPGRNGHHKDISALRNQITRTLFDHTGIRLTPHQVRHVAAKLLLDARPGHYEVVRKLLGHKNLTTTYAHYAGAETQAAIALYDQVVLDRKRGAPGRVAPDDNGPFLDPFNPFLKEFRQ